MKIQTCFFIFLCFFCSNKIQNLLDGPLRFGFFIHAIAYTFLYYHFEYIAKFVIGIVVWSILKQPMAHDYLFTRGWYALRTGKRTIKFFIGLDKKSEPKKPNRTRSEKVVSNLNRNWLNIRMSLKFWYLKNWNRTQSEPKYFGYPNVSEIDLYT